MALNIDLNDIINQIHDMLPSLQKEHDEKIIALDEVKNALLKSNFDYHTLIDKLTSAKTSFLVGIPIDAITNIYSSDKCPENYTVLATDGSQIDLDRNQSIPHYLINISKIRLSYGDDYGVDIDNELKFNFTKNRLLLTDDDHEQLLNSSLISIIRSIDEMRVLSEMAENCTRNEPVVALCDGTLIMWTLASKDIEDWIVKKLLDNQYLVYMDKIKSLYEKNKMILGSYISYPGSNDVINALKVLYCPFVNVDCDLNCKQNKSKPCDAFNGVTDRALFDSILHNGERSVVFKSQSSILNRYREHAIYFFYLKVNDEIGRVEIPKWIAEDSNSIDILHSILLNQCNKGNGYPVVLSEAHEAAVITFKETAVIREILQNELQEAGIEYGISSKAKSKIHREI